MDKQTDIHTYKQAKNYMPAIYRCGGHKTQAVQTVLSLCGIMPKNAWINSTTKAIKYNVKKKKN